MRPYDIVLWDLDGTIMDSAEGIFLSFEHAFEEMGEVARLVLQWEGYKEAASSQQLHADLTEEISDVFVFLFKLAYQCGVDVEAALRAGQIKADARYPDLDQANAELARYHARQAEEMAQLLGGEDDGCKG